jgi:formylglycine-generating enzyme required for sulfatase activity
MVALLVLFLWSPAGRAQDLLLPQPELQTQRDCETCPEMVTLPDGLLMSKSPVTRAEFRAFVEATNWDHAGWGCRWFVDEFPQGEDHPVVCMTFDGASAYAAWLSQVTGEAYRLPTVDEMRNAVMGFETSNYWWGEQIGRNRANCTGCGSAWDGKGTSPVGSFPPNPFNLLDAVGNVWIWTQDCATADCAERVLIGGGWSSPPSDLRVSKTISNAPDIPLNSYGLRVVRESD